MNLFEEQRRWRNSILHAIEKERDVLVLTNVVPKPEDTSTGTTVPPTGEELSPVVAPNNNNITSNFGECRLCRKQRRLWASICAWCGADPEDFEKE